MVQHTNYVTTPSLPPLPLQDANNRLQFPHILHEESNTSNVGRKSPDNIPIRVAKRKFSHVPNRLRDPT